MRETRILQTMTVFLALFLTLVTVGGAAGDIPRKINYQGLLSDSDGDALVGTYDLAFRIYDASSGGALLWSETGSVTTDQAGVFTTIIGSVAPIHISFEGPCWLEIEVEGETLAPRRELTSVPYAFQAMNADSLGGLSSASFSLVGHTHDEYVAQGEIASITGEMIAGAQIDDSHISHDAAIDPSKIAGNAWTAGNDGAGSGLDADMVDGLNGDAFADSGHVHDNRYYRQTELYSPGSINEGSNPVDWTKLKGVPGGFADGSDDVGGAGDGHSLDAADGLPVDALYVDNEGNVGIGTDTPGAQLEISSADQVEMILNRPGSQSAGVISFRTADSHDWFILTPSGGNSLIIQDDSFGPAMTLLQGGGMGIGTFTPMTDLDVDGSINASVHYELGGKKIMHRPGNYSLAIGVGTGTDEAMSGNTIVGDSAGYNDRAYHNTYFGYKAGYGTSTSGDNTFVGCEAGGKNGGSSNVFVGSRAGRYNSSGSWNTFVGENAGGDNEGGGANTFLGCSSGGHSTAGESNVFVGSSAGHSNRTGSFNTYVGTDAAHANHYGSYNVCIGNQAGFSESGSNKFYVANGPDTADVLVYGDFSSGNIGLGTLSPERRLHVKGVNPRVLIEATSVNPEVNFKHEGDAISDVWAIYKEGASEDLRFYQGGNKIWVKGGSGNVGIGADPGGDKLRVEGTACATGGWSTCSDARFKEGVEGISDALAAVTGLRGVSFRWKTGEYEDMGFPEGRHLGVIAQEVEEVLPQIVTESPDGEKAVAYTEIIPVLIEAIKTQQEEIEKLKARVAELEE